MSIPLISDIHLENSNLVFRFNNGDPRVANELRKIILSKIPTISIEYVIIEKNTTNLNDEIIAHRLGLLPLIVEGSALPEQVEFILDIRDRNATSKDLICSNDNVKIVGYNDPSTEILIVPLEQNQELILRCKTRIGFATDHAKWSCVSKLSFKEIPNENAFIFDINLIGNVPAQLLLQYISTILSQTN